MREFAERERDLSESEVKDVPEVGQLPERSQVLSVHSYGTYDGTRFDGIDPSALYDCWFICPTGFDEISHWLEQRLMGLGWPPGIDVNTVPAVVKHRAWSRQSEGVELFDFTESDWTSFDRPPTGWALIRINYWRKPAKDFSSDDEYQEWFNDIHGKGARWRKRSDLP